MQSLEKLRKKIDELDSQILQLLNKRAEIVLAIKKIKETENLSPYSPEREQEVYNRLIKNNPGPFPNEALKAVFREIMSASISLEKKLKIAFLGPEASFTHMAALKKFGSQVEYIPLPSIADVFNEVSKKSADYGVVPIENSIEGIINHTLDMFIDSPLLICSEIIIEISHNLLSNYPLDKIKKVYSRDTAFAQCRRWLQLNLPHAQLIEVPSTTHGVILAKKEKGAAAIASELAAKLYKMKIVAKGIEDIPGNCTRFLVIGNIVSERTGFDKTSIMFSIKDRVGALYSILRPFAKNNINLTKIESRPSKKRAWEYIFFVDFVGHQDDPNVKKALKAVSEQCILLRVLGSYPADTSGLRAE